VALGDDVAALVARAAVRLDLVVPAGALDEPVDQPLKVVGRQVLEMVLVLGGRHGSLGVLPRLR
jgi:hypothetical protein